MVRVQEISIYDDGPQVVRCHGVPSVAAGGPGLGFLALLRSRPRPLSPRSSSSSSSCRRRQWKLTATNPLARHPASPPPPRPPLILVNQSRQVARSLFRNITSTILERNLSSWLCSVSSSILRPLSLLSATTTKSILHSRSSSSPASPHFTSLTFSSTNSQTPRRNQTPSPPPSRPLAFLSFHHAPPRLTSSKSTPAFSALPSSTTHSFSLPSYLASLSPPSVIPIIPVASSTENPNQPSFTATPC